ncbi:hypothetical protein CN151_25155 [Sinorhizobium meliloti]|jgi:hypothetical protein|uniref:Uncharacterized protein n=3 Tax=Rhizobium meliloti TaxID=382 RepID=Q92Z47_RHIME|nr:DUF6522 family protein [Sinorhizobium meliloti]TWA96304.1 hypothetical protein FB000_11929 [Ensifer sp. SEMIA 134]TWB33929.1 hypothetical protein FB001_11171 [Ensifer sp. SEMIA 135]AAK65308.2 hypothetical protein SMa1192 [Sinorhizobium meliloti 1021]AEG07283.1 hypothetical protein SinmeB_6155 [Sinorhizobium meliloti BL225C]AEG57387.1 hypothetical protein Sinme_5868 [Sinorhizobium meliloti AK83]
MHVERDQNGDFTFDSVALADRFQLSSEDLRRNIRRGLVTSMVERGEGEDAGTCRLRVKIGNRVWTAILNSEDRVITEEMTIYRASSRSEITLASDAS